MNSEDSQPLRKIWSQAEKEKLLEAIKAEGSGSYTKIAKYLPQKSAEAVKAKINRYKVLARSLKPGVEDPLDFWLHSFFSPETDSVISKALLYIQLFEEHPSVEETNGIDIAAIYDFLYRITLGQSPSDMPPETWKAFEQELYLASEYVKSKCEREVLTYLSTMNCKNDPKNDYSIRKD